jgi:hypothetical protein
MRKMPYQNNVRQTNKFSAGNEMVFRFSLSKNANYRIALQLYYINKAENRKEARLPENDFRRPALPPRKQVSLLKRLSDQIHFDFGNIFDHKVMYR